MTERPKKRSVLLSVRLSEDLKGQVEYIADLDGVTVVATVRSMLDEIVRYATKRELRIQWSSSGTGRTRPSQSANSPGVARHVCRVADCTADRRREQSTLLGER